MTDRMPPERFAELWKSTGLSLRELAELLGMNGRHAATHLREMADGVRPVPGPTGVAMKALADGWRPGAWPSEDEVDDLIGLCIVQRDGQSAIPEMCVEMLRRLTGRGE